MLLKQRRNIDWRENSFIDRSSWIVELWAQFSGRCTKVQRGSRKEEDGINNNRDEMSERHSSNLIYVTWMMYNLRMKRKGNDTIADVIHMRTIRMPVRCFVTRKRACNGYKIAMNRSHDIADKVNTLEVKQVTIFTKVVRCVISFVFVCTCCVPRECVFVFFVVIAVVVFLLLLLTDADVIRKTSCRGHRKRRKDQLRCPWHRDTMDTFPGRQEWDRKK